MNWRALLICLSLLQPLSSHALEIEGTRFDASVKAGDATLQLNGAGVRSKFIIKVYTIGLYLSTPSDSDTAALTAAGPKRIDIVPLMDFSADQFTEPLVKGMKKNLPAAEFESMRPRIDAFVADLQALKEVRKGARIVLEWRPGRGTLALVDGKEVSKPVDGEDFFRGLMAIWIGQKPTQDDLKQRLLSGRAHGT
ncbi:chalcone isomerase family protein [Methyloversatilis thermotolerans]|uniref:chalcone isomerase family protein n=1 Tax=Methyloversatilis thermotolerans TaxID=1346290 RepID=UPI00037CA43F|nr:chalcone isomerase family protein [Methyloversatilis thermotolerans]